MDLRDRVLQRLVIGGADDCWVWPGALNKAGYGRLETSKPRRQHFVHRIMACAKPGETVRHTCDNPPCCNPRHLLIGTQGDNNDDMAAKGRHWCQKKTHCPQGHPYDMVSSQGTRGCRRCRAAASRKLYRSKVEGR